jgi:hypothetical protein
LLSSFVLAEVLEVTKEGISQDFVKNKVLDLRVVESSSLTVGNPLEESYEVHKFKLSGLDESSINLTIDKLSSYKINNGQSKKVDVDGDDIFDISVEVKSIRQKTVAVLTFKLLEVSSAVKEVKEVYEEEGETIVEDTSNLSEVQELQEKLAGTKPSSEESFFSKTGKSFFASNGSIGLGMLIAITVGIIIFILIIGYIIYRKFTE